MSIPAERKRFVGYCGDYCPTCDWHLGKIRNVAQQLLDLTEKHRELGYIAENWKTCNFEELLKGLDWLSKDVYCRGGCCRAGDGWSDCPIRKCCIEKGVDFCYECAKFPCQTLKEHPLFGLEYIKCLEEIRDTGLEEWIGKQ